MKKGLVYVLICAAICVGVYLISAYTKYDQSPVEIESIELLPVVAAEQGSIQNEAMHNLIAPYKREMEKTMNVAIGSSAGDYVSDRPESPLSNLVADIILDRARKLVGDVDFAVTNVGGIRTTLRAGDITVGNVYEILPFDNALLVLDYKGNDVLDIADAIALRGGEAVAGISFGITTDGKATDVRVNGKAVDKDKVYHVVTSDYLSFGNDNLTPLKRYIASRPLNIMLRDAMIDYLTDLTAEGKSVTASTDGRVKLLN